MTDIPFNGVEVPDKIERTKGPSDKVDVRAPSKASLDPDAPMHNATAVNISFPTKGGPSGGKSGVAAGQAVGQGAKPAVANSGVIEFMESDQD